MWVLVIIAFGLNSLYGDSVAVTNVPGFESREVCEAAAEQLKTVTATLPKAVGNYRLNMRTECIVTRTVHTYGEQK